MIACRQIVLVAALLAGLPVAGATAQQDVAPESRGREITGRIVDENGAPVADAVVQITRQGERFGVFTVAPDDEGRFRSGALQEGLYSVWIRARGYTRIEAPRDALYRPGDRITARLAKGGVVTGRVTDASGEPVIAIPVLAHYVSDDEGRAVDRSGAYEAETDDRGIYRIFGLPAGSYLVAAGRARQSWEPASLRDTNASVYYPSSGPDTASEVAVRLGAETASIDIVYRAVQGRTISGSVVGGSRYVTVWLKNAKNGRSVGWRSASNESGAWRFEFDGLGDGEYELEASSWADDASLRSAPRKVAVRGADVTGVELRLAPLASFEGRLEWEEGELVDGCKPPKSRREREVLVALEKVAEIDANERRSIASAKPGGELVAKSLREGSYWLEIEPPDRHWYVARIEREVAKAAKPSPLVGRPLRIGHGEAVRGARIVLRGGAAAVRGRVTSTKGEKLPHGLRVALVPTEPERKDDPVRYYDVSVAEDGAYLVEHVAPGDYRAVVLQPKGAVPLAWDEAARPLARKLAEERGVAVSFRQCERRDGLDLGF
jgi:hypothetical protein